MPGRLIAASIVASARDTRAFAISTLYALPGSGVAASSGPSRSHGTGATPASATRVRLAVPCRRHPDEREPEALAVHRLQVDGGIAGRQLELEQYLALLERDEPHVACLGQAVEVCERKLAAVRADGRVERQQRRREVRRVRRGAEVVPEDRVLAVLPFAGMAPVASVEAARVLEAPVPAAGRLEQVPADGGHVPELGRCREPACLSQRGGDLLALLELGERRPRADAR